MAEPMYWKEITVHPGESDPFTGALLTHRPAALKGRRKAKKC